MLPRFHCPLKEEQQDWELIKLQESLVVLKCKLRLQWQHECQRIHVHKNFPISQELSLYNVAVR